MGCGEEKLSKYLTQTFTAHCNAMICQQVTLLGDAEWPKVADAVIEALQLQFVDQIQWRYELIRPLVLFAEGTPTPVCWTHFFV
jgi:hypothetical protein